MQPSHQLGPFTSPHKTRRFWTLITLLCLALLCAPFVLRFLGVPLPLMPYRSWLGSAAITFVFMLPVVWLAFRFGRIGWFLVGIGFIVLGLLFRSLPL